MQESSTTLDLGLQLGLAAGMLLLMTVIHSIGLVSISKLLRLTDDRLIEHELNTSAIALLGSFGLLLFALHITEILIFALFYLGVGALDDLGDAIYFSASAYATLGATTDDFPERWRIIGALEALIGFLLIGWSTAFMVSTMKKLTD